MKNQQASWSAVLLVIAVAALSVVVAFCWPVQASQPPAAPPTASSVFVIPTPEPTLPLVVTPPGRAHPTATYRPTPTAYVYVNTPIPTLPPPPPTATSTPEPTAEPTVTPVFRPNPDRPAPAQVPRHE